MEFQPGDRVLIDADFPAFGTQLEAVGVVLRVDQSRKQPYEVRYRARGGSYHNLGSFSADQLLPFDNSEPFPHELEGSSA